MSQNRLHIASETERRAKFAPPNFKASFPTRQAGRLFQPTQFSSSSFSSLPCAIRTAGILILILAGLLCEGGLANSRSPSFFFSREARGVLKFTTFSSVLIVLIKKAHTDLTVFFFSLRYFPRVFPTSAQLIFPRNFFVRPLPCCLRFSRFFHAVVKHTFVHSNSAKKKNTPDLSPASGRSLCFFFSTFFFLVSLPYDPRRLHN